MHGSAHGEDHPSLTGGPRGEDVQDGGLEGGGGTQTGWNGPGRGTIYLV